jgi:DNA-binding GntR family transcriptional regulator
MPLPPDSSPSPLNNRGKNRMSNEAPNKESRQGTAVDDYRSLQDIVFIRLRDQIFSGELRPGDRLNTSQLARELGVSRMPIRDALTRLASVGLVENVPHRGAFVKKLSIEEVIETYYIRAALEGVAARMAARNLTKEQTQQLLDICRETENAIEDSDDKRFLDLNFTFHSIIYSAARSPQLEELIGQFYRSSEPYRELGLDLPGRFAELREEHCNIARSLAEGDPDAAEHHVREHHLNTARRIARSTGSSEPI